MQGKPLQMLKMATVVLVNLGNAQVLVAFLICASVVLDLMASRGFSPNTVELMVTAWIVVTVVQMFVLIFWMYHAAQGAAKVSPDPRRITPWWTVAWWFVPAFNIWQPYRAMSQVWNTSVDDDMDMNGPAAPNVTVWWLLLLLGPLLAVMISGGAYFVGLLVLLWAASTLSLIGIVRLVLAGQTAKLGRVSSEPMEQAA